MPPSPSLGEGLGVGLRDSFTATSKNSSVRLDMTRKKRTNSKSNHACMNCRVVSEEDEVNDNQRQYRELNWLVSLYVIADDDGNHNRTIYIHKKSRLASFAGRDFDSV